jgi:hypothetical protein
MTMGLTNIAAYTSVFMGYVQKHSPEDVCGYIWQQSPIKLGGSDV